MDNNLKVKIEYEISRIDKSLDSVEPLLKLCKLREPDIVEVTAAAQVLHSFYNGVESIVLLIFKNLKEELPNDFNWHKTLFEMAFGINSKNIIIRLDIKEQVRNYLHFRHFIRHAYSSELEWIKMKVLINELEEIWKIIKEDFELFIQDN